MLPHQYDDQPVGAFWLGHGYLSGAHMPSMICAKDSTTECCTSMQFVIC